MNSNLSSPRIHLKSKRQKNCAGIISLSQIRFHRVQWMGKSVDRRKQERKLFWSGWFSEVTKETVEFSSSCGWETWNELRRSLDDVEWQCARFVHHLIEIYELWDACVKHFFRFALDSALIHFKLVSPFSSESSRDAMATLRWKARWSFAPKPTKWKTISHQGRDDF